MERRVLGKGLGALITPEAPKDAQQNTRVLNPQTISPNRYQPRLSFKEEKLQELADSIKEKGIVQPVVVRKLNDDEYELIAGERRLRAVKMLGLDEIPVIVKNVNDQEMLEISIIENIQRDNLNPLEEAKAYEVLMKDFKFTQERVAQSVGKSRASIANILRLLNLPQEAKDALFKDAISFGHAKAILGIENRQQQKILLKKIINKGLSVREAEFFAEVQSLQAKQKKQTTKDEHVVRLEDELQHLFGTKVQVMHGKKRGKIQIEYYSLDDLERVISIFRR